MPRKPKTGAPKKRGQRKRVSVPRRIRNTPEYASLSVKRTMAAPPPGGNFNVNQMYSLMNISLDQFTRAVNVAQAYQHYRIKYVKLTIKSPYDTYANQAGGWTKPNAYYMIDKAGAIPTNINLEGLKQMGAKARALDEKPLHIGWRPSVLTVDMTAGGGAGVGQATAYKISPWLSTSNVAVFQPWNASSVDHLGVYWYVEAGATGAPPAPLIYLCEVEVQFEFKKPLIYNSVGLSDALPAEFAKLDLSPDGVEGGSDGITIPKLG